MQPSPRRGRRRAAHQSTGRRASNAVQRSNRPSDAPPMPHPQSPASPASLSDAPVSRMPASTPPVLPTDAPTCPNAPARPEASARCDSACHCSARSTVPSTAPIFVPAYNPAIPGFFYPFYGSESASASFHARHCPAIHPLAYAPPPTQYPQPRVDPGHPWVPTSTPTEDARNDHAPHDLIDLMREDPRPSPAPGSCHEPPADGSNAGEVFLEPEGTDGYVPSKEGTEHITAIIRSMLDGFRTDRVIRKWHDVGAASRDIMFQEWKKHVQWNPSHNDHMKKAFNHKASGRLSDMYRDARLTDKRPDWISERSWEDLKVYWNSDEFKAISRTNKKNRSEAEGCVHTGGGISAGTHAARLSKKYGRPATHAEVFAHMHKRRADNTWVSGRSEKVYEDYEHELENLATQQGGGVTNSGKNEAENEVWTKVVGGRNKKGRIFGLNYRIGSTSSAPIADETPSSQVRDERIDQMTREMALMREQIAAQQQMLAAMMEKMEKLVGGGTSTISASPSASSSSSSSSST